MSKNWLKLSVAILLAVALGGGCVGSHGTDRAILTLRSTHLSSAGAESGALRLDGCFFETARGRSVLPAKLSLTSNGNGTERKSEVVMADGRRVTVSLKRDNGNFLVQFSASPNADITKWGLTVDAGANEYFTGLMERVVDGKQETSWAPGIKEALDLRGQKVDMILKPTTSVYAPFYLSSRGYGVLAKTDWPGFYDFCASDPKHVKIEFEGPALSLKFYTAAHPEEIVRAHALDVGPPVLPPRWMFSPWRWRDEHTQRATYYDGTPATGPFNSEVMEDMLMMKAFGIPCGVYWIDRPWGPGHPWGYDDFEIDQKRLPEFARMVKWLNAEQAQLVLWIAPFFQGHMATNALAKGWNLPGQVRPRNGNNYPMVDFSNPAARTYWQGGVEKLLKLGVAGFKLDRSEEDIPEKGSYWIHDGRSIRENRNAYPAMYVDATSEITRKYRGDDHVLMPRAAYTGTSSKAVNWGGDIGGNQEGLRASIIAVQRAAVMGYPNWGSDTCGYNKQLLEQEVCARWLAFSCFNPIMEVGPTRNVAFWNLPREPKYDSTLIAIWRLYARLHQRLADYGHEQAKLAHTTGTPIVRPLFLVDPKVPAAWANWWTFQYGPDLLVSAIWEKNRRSVGVYLPSGCKWRDAWNPTKIYEGGQTITVRAELHQIPVFVREGSKLDLGDLNNEWAESQAIANQRPDLAKLEAEVQAWFQTTAR